MTAIKNVVVLGGTGKVGIQVVDALSRANFNVTAASRSAPTDSSFPPTVKNAQVDYSSPTSLITLFKDQDAVVEAFNPAVLATCHKTITDAIVSSGVKHVITPDFSSDTFNAHAHELEIFEPKIEAQRYLEQNIKGTDVKWTAVITGPLFDWAIPAECFWISPKDQTITILGSGNQKVSMSRISTTGRAVVHILSSPSTFNNRPAYFADYTVSTNQIVEMVKEIENQKNFETVHVPIDAFFANGKKAYAEDTKSGVQDRLNSAAYQMLGTYGVFEEGNRYGSDFGGKAEKEWERQPSELKEELKELIK